MKKPKRSTLIRKLDRIFSEYIRKRDTNHKGQVECISCQKTFQYKEVDAGHFISRKYLRTRWDEKNVHGQCRRCKIKMLYLGSNQNGYFYLCKRCNNVIPTNNEETETINTY